MPFPHQSHSMILTSVVTATWILCVVFWEASIARKTEGPFLVSTYTSFPTGGNVVSVAICGDNLLATVQVTQFLYEMKLEDPDSSKHVFQNGFNLPQKLVRNPLVANDCTFLFGDHSGRLFSWDYLSRTLNVVAGTGTPGCADGIGKQAQLDYPCALAFHPTEPFAIVPDYHTETLKRLNFPDYHVTTKAGKCNVQGGVDGVGTTARLNKPNSVLFISPQEFYFGGNSATIRLATLPDYNITTVVGMYLQTTLQDGVGTNARVGYPSDFYRLSNATILFADWANNVIRSFSLPDYVVTTIAGNAIGAAGSTDGYNLGARFSRPAYFHPYGDLLFVGDSTNNLARTLTLPTVRVNVSTFALFSADKEPIDIAQCGSKFLLLDEAGLYEMSGSFSQKPVTLTLLDGTVQGANSIAVDRAILSYLSSHTWRRGMIP